MLNFAALFAGGFSKRLPNMSCLGKLFSPLPLDFNNKAISLLCLKLVLITPFLKLMKHGGLFICASDDIEPYLLQGSILYISYSLSDVKLSSLIDLEELAKYELDDTELVAVAHPSSIFIGTVFEALRNLRNNQQKLRFIGSTHGVYVLPAQNVEQASHASLTSCLEVLQKPSYQVMKEKGAIAGFSFVSFTFALKSISVLTSCRDWRRNSVYRQHVLLCTSSREENGSVCARAQQGHL